MYKAVVMTMLLLAVGADAPAGSFDADTAVEKAKQALAEHLSGARAAVPAEMTVKSVEPRTWNDSSLGCGQRGTMAAQVITAGYAVVLTAQGRDHTVHVAETHAVVCDRPTMARKPREPMRALGLDLMLQQARDDLAQRLNADPASVRVSGIRARRWTDSGMECPLPDEQITAGPIKGYRISLLHQGRIYTYHTDLRTVRACPPIETE
jgi:hypothetical protein